MPKEASVDAGACTVFSNLCPSPCYDSLMNLPGSGKTYTISIFFAEVTSILQAREEAAEALRRDISRAQASPASPELKGPIFLPFSVVDSCRMRMRVIIQATQKTPPPRC